MKAAVVGAGAVGRRVAETLADGPGFEEVTVVPGESGRSDRLMRSWADLPGVRRGTVFLRRGRFSDLPPHDVTVVAVPSGTRQIIRDALRSASHVVCAFDDPAQVRAALAFDPMARALGLTVAVGTTMAPGLSCVLAGRLRQEFDHVEEIHVASLGTGGPACARRHHAALRGVAMDWIDDQWRPRSGGSGRELVWFPDPVGGADCYRAALADPLLLAPAFPGARRVTARLEATRRDRLTSWLPMMRPPHPEGLIGAVRVEARGRRDGRAETVILGASSPPAVAAAAVSALTARWAAAGRLARPGAAGLAEMVDSPGDFLRELRQMGVPVYRFEGSPVSG